MFHKNDKDAEIIFRRLCLDFSVVLFLRLNIIYHRKWKGNSNNRNNFQIIPTGDSETNRLPLEKKSSWLLIVSKPRVPVKISQSLFARSVAGTIYKDSISTAVNASTTAFRIFSSAAQSCA